MSKKQKIEIHKDDTLTEIDEELDFALGKLESANGNVGSLLEEIETENAGDVPADEDADAVSDASRAPAKPSQGDDSAGGPSGGEAPESTASALEADAPRNK
jgi:hypothetical protein